MKRILSLLLIIVVAILFSSCEPKKDEPVEIEFWHAMQGPLLKTLEYLVNDFQAENPNIKVNLKYQGNYSQLLQRIESQLATGSAPNISQAFGAWADKFINENLLYQLDGQLQGAEQDMYEIFYRNSLFDKKMYSVPFNKSVAVLYFNKEHFQRAGLDITKPLETWDDFRNTCKKLDEELNKDPSAEKIYPFSFSPSIWFISTLYIQNEGQFYNDKTEEILPQKDLFKDAIIYFQQLEKDGVMNLTKERTYQEDFKQGKTSMIFASSVSHAFMREEVKFEYGFFPLPHGKNEGGILSGTNLIVFKNSEKNKVQASIKLINFLLRPENIAKWVKETNYLPYRRSVLNVEFFKEHMKQHPSLEKLYAEIDFLQEEPKTEKWVSGRNIMRNKLEQIFFFNKDVDTALKEFYSEIE